MEIKLMTIFFIFLVVSVQADEYTSNQYMAIYYGDSKVNVGDSFTINCIIPVSDPITWLKDGEKISLHNVRHGKDDHAYNESENPVSGEDNKIEAMISVKRALKGHEGNYQCNSLHTNFHRLMVVNNERNVTKFKELDYFSTETPVNNILQWYFNESLGYSDNLMPNVVQNNRSSFKKESTKIGSNFSNQIPLTHNETTNKYDDRIEKLFINSTTIVTPTLIVTATKKDDLLIPNYDNEEVQLKAYDIKTSLVLSCNITKEGDDNLIWEKNGTEVSQVEELKNRYRIIEQERKFIIDKTSESDAGLYSCGLRNEKKNITVVANVAVRVPSNTAVVEGEKLTIQCTVAGTDPKIEWVVGNRTIEITTDRYILQEDEKKVQNALFIIENASLEDRGEYKCVAKNLGTEYAKKNIASDVSYVRVKGKMAALWPFLGICAEVFVLCSIILIYERRRNKTELEESDTDQNNEQN